MSSLAWGFLEFSRPWQPWWGWLDVKVSDLHVHIYIYKYDTCVYVNLYMFSTVCIHIHDI